MKNIIRKLSLLTFGIIIFLMFFVENKYNYSYKNVFNGHNFIIFIAVIVFISIIYILKKYSDLKNIKRIINKIEDKSNFIIILIFCLLFIYQILMVRSIYFESGWDIEHLINTANYYIQTGIFQNNDYYGEYPYFSVCSNNLFLENIFIIFGKFSIFIGIENIYYILVFVGIILIDLSGFYMLKTVANLTYKKYLQITSLILFIFFIGITPWMLVPYSDSFGIIFPILILYLYTKNQKTKLDYFLIGLYSLIGFYIKPMILIVTIAIIIIQIIKFLLELLNGNEIKFKKIFKNFGVFLLGIIIAVILKNQILKIADYKIDKDYELSILHYIMMGINQKTTGTYSKEDVLYSLSIPDYVLRINKNKEVYVDRINEMSSQDLLTFNIKKLLLIFNDGTLAWGREGGFYKNINQNTDVVSNVMKDFYYYNWKNYNLYSNFLQIIWIFILSFSFIATLKKEFNWKECVIFLSLLGLTLFLMIFEARARYLYVYSTYFIISALIGIESLIHKFT